MAYVNLADFTLNSTGTNSYKASVRIYTSSTGVWNADGQRVYINIGGTETKVFESDITSGGFDAVSGKPTSYTITHTFTVSSTVDVYFRTACIGCENNWHSYEAENFNSSTSKKTASYTNPAVAPGTPGKPSVSGHYEAGSSITISWGAVSGTAPIKYYVQYNQWNRDTNSWMGWGNVAEGQGVTSTSVTQKINSVGDDRWCVRYRVYASNAGGSSSWSPGSDDVYHYGVRIYKNGGWQWAKVMIYKNGKWNHAILECNKDGWQTTM